MNKVVNIERLFWEDARYELMSETYKESLESANIKLLERMQYEISRNKHEKALNIFINEGRDILRGECLLNVLLKIDGNKIKNNHNKLILEAQIITNHFYSKNFESVILLAPKFTKKYSSLLKFKYHDTCSRILIEYLDSLEKTNQHEVAKITLDRFLKEDISLFAKGALYQKKYEIDNNITYLEQAHDMYFQSGFISDAIFALILYANKLALLDFSKMEKVITQINNYEDYYKPQDFYNIANFYYGLAIRYKYLKRYETALKYTKMAIQYSSCILLENIQDLSYRAIGLLAELASKLNLEEEKIEKRYGIKITDNIDELSNNEHSIIYRGKFLKNHSYFWDIHELICLKKDFQEFQNLEKKYASEHSALAYLYLRYAEYNKHLSLLERIGYLDKAQNLEKNKTHYETQRAHILKVYAEVFYENEMFDKYLEYAEKYISEISYDIDFNADYIHYLTQNNLWDKIEKYTFLYMNKVENSLDNKLLYLRSISEQNFDTDEKYNEALNLALKIENDLNNSQLEELKNIKQMLINKGGTVDINALCNEKDLETITIQLFEQALDQFTDYIQTKTRMDYWEYNKDTKKYSWISHPEQYAKRNLQMFLSAKFGESLTLFDEIPSGAGFIDLYLIFKSGLEIIIELKMCGDGYSSSYALKGNEQLKHYLRNKKSKFGYLIVFDSRKRDFSKYLNFQFNNDNYCISVKAIDMRPSTKDNDFYP